MGRVRQVLGRWGEDLAVTRLEDAGLRVLDRNWRCADGEIDIVATDGATLVVCEVKTRSGPAFGDPAEGVDREKAARLRRLALRWLAAHETGWRDLRFDVVTVTRTRAGVTVRHLRGAF